jgi:hypothetical protein
VAAAGAGAACAPSCSALQGQPALARPRTLSDEAFIERHGPWRGPYEEGTLFFYIDEYIKDSPKDLLAVLSNTCDWLSRRLKKQSALVQKNIDALAGLLQLNPAERALLLYGTLARYQRDLRGLLVEFKVSNAQEAYAALAAVAGVDAATWPRPARRLAARTHRHDREPDLRAEHHRPGRPDEGQRTAAAGADARIPRPGDLMAVFTRPAPKSELRPTTSPSSPTTCRC